MANSYKNYDSAYFIQKIKEGDVAALSRAITFVESNNEANRVLASQILEGLISKTGNSFRLGITGVPGVGKSTFIESFGKELVSQGHKLAVLAIDPSSAKSKGSILGDKTRMEQLSVMNNVFIRPSPSSGELGGVIRATYETILLCEAAGFDFIIIETVGVGQSEVAVNNICDFFLLLMLAGAGDELQGIKRGIMEMADALAITKADGNNIDKAKAARTEFAQAMHMLQANKNGWVPRTHICSGISGLGIKEIYETIVNYRQLTLANNYFIEKRKEQQFALFSNNIEEELKRQFFSNSEIAARIKHLKSASYFDPFSEAKKIILEFLSKR